MIRRWSCLIDINNNFSTCDFFLKNHKINLFKSYVNFKRFTYKFTKFKRKSLIRFKHTSNWLIYTNVLKLWIKDFIFNKNYFKYQFFNKILINNFFFYNFNFIKNKNDNFFYNFNFIFSIFSNKSSFYFFNNKNTFFKNTPLVTAFFFKTPILNSSVLPSYNSWDNLLYVNGSKIDVFNINELFDLLFFITLKKIVELKKILILLYYINLLNFKNVK